MRIRINAALGNQGLSEASTQITKEERDHLFDVVVTLSNFADEKGLAKVAQRLEDVLDCLLEDEDGSARDRPDNFKSRRPLRLTPSFETSGGKRTRELFTDFKHSGRSRLSALR